MEDEEEIDIIGDYDDISKISSGQLLSCDYTVHPKWVNENAEGGNFWSDSVPKHDNLENNVEVLHSEEVVIEEPEVSNKTILDLEWAGEIVSQNEDVVFEDDIPATTEEVIEDDEYEECEEEEEEEEEEDPIHSKSQEIISSNIYNSSNEWDESVAAFETHPAPKNNKYIGPTNSRSLLKVKIENPLLLSPNPRSLLKTNCFHIKNDQKQQSKFKQTLTISTNLFEKVGKTKEILKQNDLNKEKMKFKQSLKINQMQAKKFKIKKKSKNSNVHSNKSVEITSTKKDSQQNKTHNILINKKGSKVKKNLAVLNYGENITINHDDTEPTLNKKSTSFKKSLGVSSNTLTKLQKVESDEEVDIEADLCEDEIIDLKKSLFGTLPQHDSALITKHTNKTDSSIGLLSDAYVEKVKKSNRRKISTDEFIVKVSDELVFEIRNNLEIPKHELILTASHITDLEKYFNSEFFDGRSSTKTPEQYLRIRNHILTMWNVMGKNGYVSKTSVRNGLKHGGDVNSISRIHRLLEQIGAINFGYQGKYFEYVRPLDEYFSMFIQNKCQQINSESSGTSNTISNLRTHRVRTRTNYLALENDNESDSDINYTIEHQDGIFIPKEYEVCNSKLIIRNIKHIKTEQDLVVCLKFTNYNLAPFKVSITLSTLLCVQLHSLSSNYEVMGFLGGYRSKSIGRNKMCITRYKPCKTTEHSGTMCEMCPISQVVQSGSLKQEGYELLGWFHSHPLFPPCPSRTDVQTQIEMQMQFSAQTDRTYVGLILSCVDMNFKCIYVLPKDYSSNLNDKVQPYELNVDVIKDCTNFKYDIEDVIKSIDTNNESSESKTSAIEKFKSISVKILKQYGYDPETFFSNIF